MTGDESEHVDAVYAGLIREVMAGELVRTRNAETWRKPNHMLTFAACPLVGVRKTPWRLALREWEWFMSGSDDINDLHPSVRHWWEPWAKGFGNTRVLFNYSTQFRRYRGAGSGSLGAFDQIAHLIAGVRDHPFSRRNVVTTWNAADMAHQACPITNCHNTVTQAFVDGADALHLTTYQRSADVVCGLPANWVQMWAFLLWLARRTGRGVGTLTWVGGDVHVYRQHEAVVGEILAVPPERYPRTPGLVYAPTSEDFRADDFSLNGPYEPVVTTRAEMVV